MIKVTRLFILGMVVLVAGYDVYAISTGGFTVSISHTMIEWSYKYPIFTFLMGVTCGHLFWRMGDSPTTKKISDFVHETEDDLSSKQGDK